MTHHHSRTRSQHGGGHPTPPQDPEGRAGRTTAGSTTGSTSETTGDTTANTTAGPGHPDPTDATPIDPAAYWERRYASASGAMWSGRVNAQLQQIASNLTPGTALDLGCGEGGDVLWLANNGWRATGIDISETALARARKRARAAGLASSATFIALDLSRLGKATLPASAFDLVTASFLHSPVELERISILRAGADLVAPGGHLLITTHAAPPPWSRSAHGDHHHRLVPPQTEAEMLSLADDEWETLLVESRVRAATGPNGELAELEDGILLFRRNG